MTVIGHPFVFAEAIVDQQPELNEHREVRDLLREILKNQEQILRRLELLEQRIGQSVRD